MARLFTILLAVLIGAGAPAAAQPDSPDLPRTSDRPGLSRRINVRYDQLSLHQALEDWAQRAGVPLMVKWSEFELAGLTPDQTVTLDLERIPAGQVLALMFRQAAPQADLIIEPTPWYIQVLTREQANRRPVVRVYDVADLIMAIPAFEDAPEMSLSSGGGDGGSALGDFGRDDERGEARLTRQERGERLAQLIRDTIEPDLWIAQGGQHASIRYFRGRLVVRAPRYVQQQIGPPRRDPSRPLLGAGQPRPPSPARPPASGPAPRPENAGRGGDENS
ncbi:MAG: hypothetical protein ACLFVN_09050 [Phycisphaeraceae bacterium]